MFDWPGAILHRFYCQHHGTRDGGRTSLLLPNTENGSAQAQSKIEYSIISCAYSTEASFKFFGVMSFIKRSQTCLNSLDTMPLGFGCNEEMSNLLRFRDINFEEPDILRDPYGR
jgi:hypothetical protein